VAQEALEPTGLVRSGHANVETLRALVEAQENFPGRAVIISHDRFFLGPPDPAFLKCS
jgi:ATPase subunit of ABC transporter with duplicated ATPase domains